jgi:2-dehydro-3-deoxyphosphogalactonate aldolase
VSNRREIIAILRGIRPDEIIAVCEALIAEGITKIEVPLNSPLPLASIKMAVETLGAKGEFGAGTVLSAADVEAVSETGASFIVSPDANPEVIARTRALSLGSYPGVLTPTEAFSAIRAGATGLKIFPASVIGADGIKAMKAVLPAIPVYAVGGAHPGNFDEYAKAGCAGVGMGGHLWKSGMSPDDVAERARAIVSAFDEAFAG